MAAGKKIGIAAVCIVAAACTVYFVYFHHPPPADIMAANRANGASRLIRKADYSYEEDYEEDEGAEATPQSSKRKWERWTRENKFVSIGELYNKCDGDDKIMVGKTVMMEDKKNGGVTSYTYVNATWGPSEVTEGEMFIDVKYNGKDLYSNHWDLCTVEDNNEEDRIIFCPIKPGQKNYIKRLKIPNYIPKGEYVTKAWATNQDNEVLGCAFSKFIL